MTVDTFVPSYVWPRPAIPFRVYYDDGRCRIFIIENVPHNWPWLKMWRNGIRPSDWFFVLCGWFHDDGLARETDTVVTLLDLPRDRFIFLCNAPGEAARLGARGLQAHVIPHNAWLDERRLRPIPTGKSYRAIYVARRAAFKRHYLAVLVEGLALVVGSNYGAQEVEVPPHAYLNAAPLTPVGVCLKINQAMCGLALSAVEGGCYASGEYLLCGLPVVSTPSEGGRDLWYTEYNAIVCDPDAEAVAAAVDRTVALGRDPVTIRQMHIEQAIRYRQAFVLLLAEVFRRAGVSGVDASTYFADHFFHKMRRSMRPDFASLFGSPQGLEVLGS